MDSAWQGRGIMCLAAGLDTTRTTNLPYRFSFRGTRSSIFASFRSTYCLET